MFNFWNEIKDFRLISLDGWPLSFRTYEKTPSPPYPNPNDLLLPFFFLLSFFRTKAVFFCFKGFPPPAYVISPPVAFPMGSGYTFPAGVSVPGTFLQPTAHSPAGNQVQAGKQSHIPYSQQRPSGPGPMNQGPQQPQPPSQQPLTSLPAQPTAQSTSQLQVQALAQQQQSPTKAVPALGKSPPHHSGFQQVGDIVPPRWLRREGWG